MVKELWKAGAPGGLPPTCDSAELELHVLKYEPLYVTKWASTLKAEFDPNDTNSKGPSM